MCVCVCVYTHTHTHTPFYIQYFSPLDRPTLLDQGCQLKIVTGSKVVVPKIH